MKKRVMLGVLYASTTLAMQAVAGGYVEGRVGYIGNSVISTETVGGAIGFEVVGSSGTSFGAEFVADSLPSYSTSFAGVNLRAGTAVDESSRLFLTVGRVWPVYGYGYSYVGGLGYQTDFSKNGYVSFQVQHVFDSDFNRGMVGVGVRF